MTPEEILHNLSHATSLPTEALKAAGEQREAMVPLFIAEIEKYLALPYEERLGREDIDTRLID